MATNRSPPFLAAAERRDLIDRDSRGTEGRDGHRRRPNEGPQVTSNAQKRYSSTEHKIESNLQEHDLIFIAQTMSPKKTTCSDPAAHALRSLQQYNFYRSRQHFYYGAFHPQPRQKAAERKCRAAASSAFLLTVQVREEKAKD